MDAHIQITKEILTTKQLAELLSKKVQTVYNWKVKGMSMPPKFVIPCTKGDRYLLSDVLAWAESLKQPAPKRGRPRKAA